MCAERSWIRGVSIAWLAVMVICLVSVRDGSVAADDAARPPLPALESTALIDDQGPDDIEPMLRGPLHEAFVEPVAFDPAPTMVVPKTPPEPIEEMGL